MSNLSKFLIALMVFLIGMESSLGGEKPLVIKTSKKNFAALIAERQEESCKVFSKEIQVKEVNGAYEVTSVYDINLDNDINEIIEAAEDEQVTKSHSKLGCEDPGTAVTAYKEDGTQVILYTAGGCASPRWVRNGPNTKYLMELVGAYCKTTY